MTWQEHFQKGSLALAQEDFTVAQTELSLALKQASTLQNDCASLGSLYGLLAQSFFRHRDYDQAEPLLKQAIQLDNPEPTNLSWSSRARDLISLSEILRVRGATAEALSYLEDALKTMPPASRNLTGENGLEESDALKNLLSHASKRHQALSDSGLQKSELDQLEHEYGELLESAKPIVASSQTSHSDLIQTLIKLAKFSTKLELLEQSEKYLDLAFGIAFGPNHARQLTVPEDTSHVDPTVITELLMTKTNYLSCVYDYASAARCLADLIKWLEKQPTEQLLSQAEMNRLVAPFSGLMQKADLYTSARILIKQAIDFEDCGDISRAISIYDKVLVILNQLFPPCHLEIAQIMEFKAAALEAANRSPEARMLRETVAIIEHENVDTGAEAENRLARMPSLKL